MQQLKTSLNGLQHAGKSASEQMTKYARLASIGESQLPTLTLAKVIK
jgi:hypothetical protein